MGIEDWDVDNYLKRLGKENIFFAEHSELTKTSDFMSDLNCNDEKGEMIRNEFKLDIGKKSTINCFIQKMICF